MLDNAFVSKEGREENCRLHRVYGVAHLDDIKEADVCQIDTIFIYIKGSDHTDCSRRKFQREPSNP